MVRRLQLVLLSAPLRPAYRMLRRSYQLSRFFLRRPHEGDFKAFARFPDREGLFLDVGASSGTSAMSFRLYNKRSRILSIEPNAFLEPELQSLRRLVKPFDYMIAAAADEEGDATIYVPLYKGVPITAESALRRQSVVDSESLRRWLGDRMDGPNFRIEERPVRLRRLDDLDLAPDFVKIDAEGAELLVLRGLEQTLERHRPIILLERGETFDEVRTFLSQRGYDAQVYDEKADRFEPLDTAGASLNAFFLPGATA